MADWATDPISVKRMFRTTSTPAPINLGRRDCVAIGVIRNACYGAKSTGPEKKMAQSWSRIRGMSLAPILSVPFGGPFMKVREIMTADVKCCRPDDSLNSAAQLMWDFDCGCVPVVDDSGRPVAMLTDRDICMAAYTQGVKLTERTVASAMSSDIYTCRADDELTLVEEMMRQCRVRRLPVVDGEGRLAGIICLNDIAEAAERERATSRGSRRIPDFEIARVLSAVCKHREAVLADGNSHLLAV
jgi:CBS domain-containing protein